MFVRALRCVAAGAVGVIALATLPATPVDACPFCVPSLTYSEQIEGAAAAVFARRVEADGAGDAESGKRVRYEIVQILHQGDEAHSVGQSLLAAPSLAEPGENLFLLLQSRVEDQLEWAYPLPMTTAAAEYLTTSPRRSAEGTVRAAYYLKYLEHADGLIAADAYSEFGSIPYADVRAVAEEMSPEKLRRWLSDPELTPMRTGLYGLMLGLCGAAEDREFLRELVKLNPEDVRVGIDGVMAGYVLLAGEEGLQIVRERKFDDRSAPFSETFSALQALRFLWQDGGDCVSKVALLNAFRSLLDRPLLAELVIPDLGRFEDWESLDRIVGLYGQGEYDLPSMKTVIIRYLLAAEHSEDEGGEPAAHAQAARRWLVDLRRRDPKLVASVERYAFD